VSTAIPILLDEFDSAATQPTPIAEAAGFELERRSRCARSATAGLLQALHTHRYGMRRQAGQGPLDASRAATAEIQLAAQAAEAGRWAFLSGQLPTMWAVTRPDACGVPEIWAAFQVGWRLAQAQAVKP
jgi:hypothetical protein